MMKINKLINRCRHILTPQGHNIRGNITDVCSNLSAGSYCWHCLHTTQSRNYATDKRPSVHLSHHRGAAFTQPSCRQPGSGSMRLQHGAQQQMRAVPRLQQRNVAEPDFVYLWIVKMATG